MSSPAEVLVAAIDAQIAEIRETVQVSVRHCVEVIDTTSAQIGALGGGRVAAVHRAQAALQEAAQHLENSFQPTEAAIEHLAAWSTAVQNTHG